MLKVSNPGYTEFDSEILRIKNEYEFRKKNKKST